jgi:hypothetical protein
MARQTVVQNSFNSGELSDDFQGRIDHEKYQMGLRLAQNSLVLPQGPVYKRPGTKFVSEVKDSAKKVRLIEFQFNITQTYAIEFGHQYIRFYTNEGLLVDGDDLPIEVASTYTEDDIFKIKFVQSADVLYLGCPGFRPKQLNRTGALTWTLTDFKPKDGPWDAINIDAGKTLTLSAAGDVGTTSTITASGTGFTPFTADWVGRLVRIQRGTNWRSLEITAYSSSTVVTGTYQDANPSGYTAGASTSWRWGSWADIAEIGWPTVPAIYQQRLYWGNSTAWPSRIWGSESGDYNSYSPTEPDGTIIDSNALNSLADATQVNAIAWMVPSKILHIGTFGSELSYRAGSITTPETLTPTNGIITPNTAYGSNMYLQAHKPGNNVVLFADVPARKIREYIYDYQQDEYVAPELTLFARHMTKSGIVDTAYGDDVYWMCLGNGNLVSMTYLRSQQVVGFANHILGGIGTKVESICAIRSPDNSYMQLWMVVSRIIDEETVRYVEFMTKSLEPDNPEDKEDLFYVDCGLTYDGAATNVISGLDHLEGENVAIWADGAVRPSKQVVDGEITLGDSESTKASKVHVGLPYEFIGRTLEPDTQYEFGSGMGKTKRIDSVTFKLVNTLGLEIGPSLDQMEEVVFKQIPVEMDDSPDLFTGYVSNDFEGDYAEDVGIYFRSTIPGPVMITAISADLNINGG